MADMRIINNGKIIYPEGRPAPFEHPNQGDGYRIRAYMQGVNGFSAFGLTEPQMGDTAWSKVLTIGEYIFRKFNWTGSDQISIDFSVVTNLKNRDTNASMNGGKGPTYSCGSISLVTTGLLTAYGVQVIRLGGTTKSGQIDVTIAVFCPEFNKWVWIQPHTKGYVLMADGITPASPLELESYYRLAVTGLTYKSGTSTIETDTGYDQYHQSNGSWWKGTGVNDPQNGGYFYKCGYTLGEEKRALDPSTAPWQTMWKYPLYISGRTVVSNALASSIDNIFSTVNSLMITSISDDKTKTTLKFKHNMIAFKTMQKSVDGTTWVNMRGMSDIVDSNGSGSMYYRAISMQGVLSNIVQIGY
jgi:hypothetical protein